MIFYDETVDRMRAASEPIKDEPWDFKRDSRELAGSGAWCGKVSVHENARDEDGSAFVSLELDGLTCEQAEALLRALTPGFQVMQQCDVYETDIGDVVMGRRPSGAMTYGEFLMSGGRGIMKKYGLSRAKAERLVSNPERFVRLVSEHEAWRDRNGLPAHSSPLSRGMLIDMLNQDEKAERVTYDIPSPEVGKAKR